ncbi:polysaccharide biosynthesis protein [Bacillus sp. CFBP 13597]|nr:polysaccharide biosynthesis protein [Bacillus sp. CFBP 13597]
MFKNKTILITGGTGSWGYELTRKLLQYYPKEIRIYSRNEFAQITMLEAFNYHPSLKFIIGDVRDYEAIKIACKNVDFIFHLAALKHVPVCESQPEEALKTNVDGTLNVINASIMAGVKKVIDVSTDKAVDPINFYGLTKALGEKLMIQANCLSETNFVCIRGGNVLGTNGSVLPLFKRQIQEGRNVSLTSNDMTRFFLSVSDAVNLLLEAALEALGGETFVMKMNSCRIIDLAEVLIKNYPEKPIILEEIGIRPGEKLHEVLVSNHEAPHTYEFNDKYFVILPSHPSLSLQQYYANFPKVNFEKYDSNRGLMSPDEIRMMLEKGGFLD